MGELIPTFLDPCHSTGSHLIGLFPPILIPFLPPFLLLHQENNYVSIIRNLDFMFSAALMSVDPPENPPSTEDAVSDPIFRFHHRLLTLTILFKAPVDAQNAIYIFSFQALTQ